MSSHKSPKVLGLAALGFLTLLPGFVLADACDMSLRGERQAFPCRVFARGISASSAAELAQQAGARLVHRFDRQNLVALSVANSVVFDQLKYSFLKFYPDRLHHASVIPNGRGGTKGKPVKEEPPPGAGDQVLPEGIARVGGPIHSNPVGIAIVDSGLDLGNEDLLVAKERHDSYGGTGMDLEGHGTHVGGIAAALNNSKGVVGVAPDATLYSVRVLDQTGSGYDSDIVAGLEWVLANHKAVDPEIRVVNMSLGRDAYWADSDPDFPLHKAVRDLVDNDVVVVVSAGNNQSQEITDKVPAGYPEVLAVASTTAVDGSNRCRRVSFVVESDTASYFTTDGAGVAISAPGANREDISKGCSLNTVGILSLAVGGGTTRMSGTSMSAPHVSGMVASWIANNLVAADVEAVRARLALASNLEGGSLPKDSPAASYTFDGVREGVLQSGANN